MARWIVLVMSIALTSAACGSEANAGAAGATLIGNSAAFDTCDQFAGLLDSTKETARAETVTAAEVVAWQETRDGRESRYRQRPVDDIYTVCLVWGFVPAPGLHLDPGEVYDASTWVVDATGRGEPDIIGFRSHPPPMPSDVLNRP